MNIAKNIIDNGKADVSKTGQSSNISENQSLVNYGMVEAVLALVEYVGIEQARFTALYILEKANVKTKKDVLNFPRITDDEVLTLLSIFG